MKIKRLLVFLLVFCMMFSMLSAFSYADGVEETTDTTTTGTEDVEENENASEDENVIIGEDGEVIDPTEIIIDESGMTGDGTKGNKEYLKSFTLADENENLAFYINDITGFFAIHNKKTDAIWFSNPMDYEKDQIALSTNMDKLQSQLIVTYLNASFDILTIPSTEAHIVSEHKGNQQIFTYVFSGATRNFSIPICYELKEDYLDIKVMMDSIEENSDARITQITLLPHMGAGGLKDTGYALIPDGSGSLMTFNKVCKNLSQYTGYIYNRDRTASSDNASYVDLNETVSLPVYGVYKNGAGFLTVITEGAGTGAIKANVSKLFNSYNSVTSHYIVRDTQSRRNSAAGSGDGVYYSDKTCGNISLRVYPLGDDNSTYVGMAQKYQDYLVETQNLAKLDENASYVNALNIDLFCAVKTPTHFLGIPYTGVKELTSFSEVEGIVAKLKEKNISNMLINLTGWSSGGLESAVPLDFKTESKVGSVKEAQALLDFADEQNVNISFDADMQNFYAGTSKIKKFQHTAFALSNTPVTVYPFSKSLNRSTIAGSFYHLIHPQYMIEFTNTYIDNALKKGIKNFSFQSAGVDPYATYNKDNMLTRDESTELTQEMFVNANEKVEGILSTKVGNSYVLGSVNNIVETPVYSSYLIISQTSVPFYQIALRGYVNMASPALNLSSEVSELELKCAESGISLYYQLMKAESTEFQDTSFSDYYACSFDDYYEILSETYGRMEKVYNAVGASEIINHEILDDVRISTFSNGAKVYVNYGYTDTSVSGVSVAARSYTVVGGAK